MAKIHIGLIGLGVMGKNLALNIESKGYQLVTYEMFTGIKDLNINLLGNFK